MRKAARRGGWLDFEDVRAAGITEWGLRRLVREGLLVRERKRLFRLAGAPASWEAAVAATVKSLGGVASHASAARLWGFDDLPLSPLHVTVERHNRGRRPSGNVVTHTASEPLRAAVGSLRGIRVTAPIRTIVDVAATPVSDAELQRLLDHFIAHRLVTPARLLDAIAREPRRQGSRRLRALLGRAAGGAVDSVVEAELMRVLVAHGLPAPVTQYRLRSQGRTIARLDFAWPPHKVALELDGYLFHADVDTFVADRDRGNLIVAAGWRLMRTTPARLRSDPAGLSAEIAAVLDIAKPASPRRTSRPTAS